MPACPSDAARGENSRNNLYRGVCGVSSPKSRHSARHHMMSNPTRIEVAVRTTLALDDDLLAEAQRLTGMTEKTALVREALRALIERESARRLARLGGSEPNLDAVPRRRTA